jgi:hypothetical protein
LLTVSTSATSALTSASAATTAASTAVHCRLLLPLVLYHQRQN